MLEEQAGRCGELPERTGQKNAAAGPAGHCGGLRKSYPPLIATGCVAARRAEIRRATAQASLDLGSRERVGTSVGMTSGWVDFIPCDADVIGNLKSQFDRKSLLSVESNWPFEACGLTMYFTFRNNHRHGFFRTINVGVPQ
jgi:hypothetical protein